MAIQLRESVTEAAPSAASFMTSRRDVIAPPVRRFTIGILPRVIDCDRLLPRTFLGTLSDGEL